MLSNSGALRHLMTGYLIICAVTAAFALVAHRLSTTSLTAPMVFISLGVLLAAFELLSYEQSHGLLHPVAEITLVVLLFLDAAQVDLMALRKRHVWPLRMLLVGLPLTVLIGTLIGLLFFPTWPLVAVALLAAILAPTDAALGQAVVTNPNVPIRSRRALTVESGLNDGLALPLILLLASLTAAEMEVGGAEWVVFGLKQVILGPLVGIIVGAVGGFLLLRAKARNTTSDIYEGAGALAMAGMAYLMALQVGGNGFIAAFVAGLTFGGIIKGACKFVYEFTEGEGQILAWASFLLLGAALVPEAVAHLTWPMFAVILGSLFLVRPLAIWASLIGTDATPTTRLFFGWFGPRGLATALFALLVMDQIPSVFGDPILHTAINAVWISALLHGLTAAPAALWYGRKVASVEPISDGPLVVSDRQPIPQDP